MSRLNVIDDRPSPPDATGEPAGGSQLDELRRRLAGRRGARYWRSLEELAGAPGFRELLRREFPRFAAEWEAGLDRRRFLQLSSAALALAGLTGCSKQPPEAIVPYVRQPEEIIPGRPLYFATATTRAGYASPLLAESHLGRPTKLEGNPEHPASLGATDLYAQAAVLDLYDPDRLQAVTHRGRIRTWGAFVDELSSRRAALAALEGEGLAILTGRITSPSLGAQLARLRQEMPKARWYRYEAAAGLTHAAAVAAFGEPVETRYELRQADVVLAVESDFATEGPGAVRYARDLMSRRRIDDQRPAMNRLYCVESMPSATGTLADHRLALKPSDVERFVLALAARLGVEGAATPPAFEHGGWVEAVAADLEAHRGRSLVIAGEHLEVATQVLIHGINAVLGNAGTTVLYSDPVAVEPSDPLADLGALVAAMRAGEVETLIVLGANPVYDAPADLEVAAAMQSVPLRVFLGQRIDETGELCHWQIPEAHELERWGDARAYDGTITFSQPLITPLYDGKSPSEVLAVLLGDATVPARELLRRHYRELDDRAWRRALHDGFLAGSALPPRPVTLKSAALSAAAADLAGRAAEGLELSFRPDPTVFDGRFANNGWLQECPKPLTKLTWDNALLMSPRTARELGLGDLVRDDEQQRGAPRVRLAAGERSLDLPVWVVPGHADGCLTLHLGYGRRRAGRVGDGCGVDANALRTSTAPWHVAGVAVTPLAGRYLLASTQSHHSMEGRDLVREASLDAYRADPHVFDHGHHGPGDVSLMDQHGDFPPGRHQWGMTIDLGACTGCNACIVACQAENNIPVVGKDQVARGREMHWIRVDRYFQGDDADHVTAVLHQPVLCMQCEQAPCEVVCPVAATVHSDEGLNDMVYNRCVGTRYCSNNCPYKVRRFNFLLYADFETPQLKLGRNPDVTVRSRGVMEKCTYCVQRINEARITAKREGRLIRDGEVTTACQQVCPTQAITFGNVADPQSAVSRAKEGPRNYRLLEELGTRPRTTYLARLRNPNPALEPAGADHHQEGHG
ncbi:MAG: 4Fe-4S dicluster domain-containing protein [Acidobacteria bacterium]|nr:MAG: 4Fe-4S dicluster domain-containing protein [Acidobacteriota bacterium]